MKPVTVSIVFPSICHEMIGPDAMILVFWMFSFKPAFLLSSFTFTKRLFSASFCSAIRVVSAACLKLLIFPLEILIPACDSSSLLFHIMYSAYKLNKQGDDIQPWCSPFPILNQSVVPCLVLTVASWPVSQETGKVVWYSHLFKNFPQFLVIHTVKGFSVVNEAEVDTLLDFPCFLYDPMDAGKWPTPLLWNCYFLKLFWRVYPGIRPITRF